MSKFHGLAFPLNFPSVVAELNLLAVLSLLNFGSGYRVPLHEQTKRGAWDNMRALVFSLYLTSSTEEDLLSAKGMKAIGWQKIAELMRVDVYVERKHETIPAVMVGELTGPMYELVRLITQTLNETGEVLERTGYPDLGTFVLEALKKGEAVGAAKGAGVDLETVLQQIVRAIPAFQDMATINGTRMLNSTFIGNALGKLILFCSRLCLQESTIFNPRNFYTFQGCQRQEYTCPRVLFTSSLFRQCFALFAHPLRHHSPARENFGITFKLHRRR